MKTRNDFVSNSSSSSFVVLHKDNKYGMLLDGFYWSPSDEGPAIEHLSLQQYMDKFGWREIFESDYRANALKDKDKMEFLNDQQFADRFLTGTLSNALPIRAKDDFDAYCALTSALKAYEDSLYEKSKATKSPEEFEKIFASSKISEMRKEQEKLEKMLISRCVESLEQSLKEIVLDYAEVEDHWNEAYSEMDEEYESECEKIKLRIDYLKSLDNKITFSRYFNNH